jgi:hypothetical protein
LLRGATERSECALVIAHMLTLIKSSARLTAYTSSKGKALAVRMMPSRDDWISSCCLVAFLHGKDE